MLLNLFSLVNLNLYNLNNVNNRNDSWNIRKVGFGRDNLSIKKNFGNLNETVLSVYYPSGSYSPSKKPGGVGFYSNPPILKGANEATLSYQVYFDSTFDPVYGGKLPGLFISDGYNFSGGSGGNHTVNSSCRIAWRSNFTGEVYLYVPESQISDYYDINNFVSNGKYGDSLWKSSFQFEKEQWNNVTVKMRLNTFSRDKNNNTVIPLSNGKLEVTINNNTEKFDKLIWTRDQSYSINTLLFSTFFGGSTEKYATKNDTYSYFKNIQVFNKF